VVVVAPGDLQGFVRELFERAGMPAEHARTVADVLVWANLRGIDSHGVLRIPRYVEMIDTGVVNPEATITIRTETPAALLIEADRAIGPVALTFAMRAAAGKAREAGVGLAFVRATTHTAALGYYTLKAAEEGLAAIALAGSWPNMAYHGARAAGVSTSPISIAVPRADGAPVVLDIGTGVVAVGKLTQARKTGQPIPPGWALDSDGNPTTDPARAEIPLPLGGPKGSGLALMFELITSLIVANPILADHLDGTPGGQRHKQNALALAIDIARFTDLASFRKEVDGLVRILKGLPRDPAVLEILMPGERGHRTLQQRTRQDIPIPRAIMNDLSSLARKFGLTPPGSG